MKSKILLVFWLGVFMFSLVSSAVWEESLNTDLEGYWSFNETSGNAYDISGNGDTMVELGTVPSNLDGIINNSRGKFENGNSFKNTNVMNFDYSQSFTLSSWIYYTGAHTVSQRPMGTGTGTGGTFLSIWLIDTSGTFKFEAGKAGSGYSLIVEGGELPINQWSHVITTYDGSSHVGELFINNVSKGTDTNTDSGTTISTQLSLGSCFEQEELEDSYMDETILWSRVLTDEEIENYYNSGDPPFFQELEGDITIDYITPPTPVNYYNTTNPNFTIQVNVTSTNVTFSNITYSLRNVNGTHYNVTFTNETYSYNYTNIPEAHYHYDVEVCGISDITSNQVCAITETRNINHDVTPPLINITSPSGVFDYLEENFTLNLNWSVTDENLDSCWYVYDNTTTYLNCSSNSTQFNYTKDQNSLTFYSNDTFGNLNSEVVTWNYKVFENSRTYNTTTYETAYETYSINVTANSSLTAINLLFNGTSLAMTNQGSGIWSYARDLPSSTIGNNSINFSFTYAGSTIFANNLTTQTISPIQFGLCNATLTSNYLNISFKDEGNLSSISATIPTSTFEYYLGSGDETKTLTFINNTANPSYVFCASPNTTTFHIDPYVQYSNTDYPQRIWNPTVIDYTNSTTNQTLYLSGTSDGIYVTFQVINSGDQTISGVSVTAERTISGSSVLIGSGTTGDDGTVTFWLNPDFTHDFNFSKTGYTTYTTSFPPAQTSYTIILSGGSTTNNNYFQGIDYSINPMNTYLVNDTVYSFEFNLTSSFWDVSMYGFNLRLANGTTITGDSTSVEGTNLELNYNTTNQSIVYMDYYWTINGTTINATRIWVVQNTGNTDWSIANFFADLSAYMSSGLFGLDNFGLNLIIFIIIFVTSGIMSYKLGFTSPISVLAIIFSIVFFLDVVVDIIPTIRGIDNLLTYVIALILTVTIFTEVRRG